MPADLPTTCLSFRLGERTFGVDVAGVSEVLDLAPVTPLPETPDLLRGVLDLRGTALPVLDLRAKLGLPRAPDTRDTRFVVFEVNRPDGLVRLGAVVDAVRDVFPVEAGEIEPPPHLGGRLDATPVSGLVRREASLVVLLDTGRLFSADEIDAVLDAGVALEDLGDAGREAADG